MSLFNIGERYPTVDGGDTLCVHQFSDGRFAFVSKSLLGHEFVYVANKNGYPTDGNRNKIPVPPDTIAEMFS